MLFRSDEPVERGGVDALRITDRVLDESKMGPVNERHAIEQEKAGHGKEEKVPKAKFQVPKGGKARNSGAEIRVEESVPPTLRPQATESGFQDLRKFFPRLGGACYVLSPQ